MEFYIDSAHPEEIKEACKLGILSGVTTNPSLIARERNQSGKKFIDLVKEICTIVEDKPVSVEVLETNTENMLREARSISGLARNVVVKLPCIENSLLATRILTSEGIKTNLTLCFSALQALLVAKCGATYVSPFVGRIADIGQEEMGLIADIKQIYYNYQLPTKIIVASVRNPLHILYSAKIGADIVTVPFSVIGQLMKHYLTEQGLETFLKDTKNSQSDN